MAIVPWRVVLITVSPLFLSMLNPLITANNHRVVGVLTSPGPKRRRNQAAPEIVQGVTPGVDVIVSNHPSRWADMVSPLQPDLIICMGMPWRVPDAVLALPSLGAINGHPSLLPRYRGAGPNAVGWQFRNGERETGITVHRMASGFDTGPILSQIRIPIRDDDDADSIGRRYFAAIPDAFQQALERISSGDSGTPQNEDDATYADYFEYEWQFIDWANPARTIHNQVRSWLGLEGMPRGAVAEVDGKQVRIIKSRLPGLSANSAAPSTVLERRDDGSLLIQCGDGPVEVLEWSEVADDCELQSCHTR